MPEEAGGSRVNPALMVNFYVKAIPQTGSPSRLARNLHRSFPLEMLSVIISIRLSVCGTGGIMGSLEMPYWGSVIHVLKHGRTEWRGKQGQYSVIARLVPRHEYLERHPDKTNAPTFGDQLRSAQQYETRIDPFGKEILEVPLQTIAAGFNGVDFDQMILIIENQFVTDRGESPIFPSDMVDELREQGVSEDTIQELLEWEKKGRGLDKGD
jgi:hypothetical protein